MLIVLQLLALPLAAVLTPLYALWVLARGRDGWVKHQASRRFRVSPVDLYRLLDPENPDNRWRRRGCELTPIPGAHGRFRMVDPRIPDERMILTVTHATPGAAIAFAARPEAPKNGDALHGSASRYDFTPFDGGVIVKQQEFMLLRPEISLLAHSFHELLMRFAIGIDLAKLKLEAQSPFAPDPVELSPAPSGRA